MIKPVFLQLKRPSGNYPGHVLEGFFDVQDDTVHLVDRNGAAVKDPDGRAYSRKLAANEHPKVIAQRLLRSHYDARGNRSMSGFDRGPIFYPKVRRA
jgi:hypothetical protein